MRNKFFKMVLRRGLVGGAILVFACVFGFFSPLASQASVLMLFDDPSGLSAEAMFSYEGNNWLKIILTNTSTGSVSDEASDQILTTISFDLGGKNIVGGGVTISPGSVSLNFDNLGPGVPQLEGGADISGEWGYGNNGTTNLLPNIVSAMEAGVHKNIFEGADIQFAGNDLDIPNLTGPNSGKLDGPEGGLVANPFVVDPGGLGVIQDSVIIMLLLEDNPDGWDLNFLNDGAIVEFGSDSTFASGSVVPIPSAILLLGSGLLGLAGLRKKFIGRG